MPTTTNMAHYFRDNNATYRQAKTTTATKTRHYNSKAPQKSSPSSLTVDDDAAAAGIGIESGGLDVGSHVDDDDDIRKGDDHAVLSFLPPIFSIDDLNNNHVHFGDHHNNASSSGGSTSSSFTVQRCPVVMEYSMDDPSKELLLHIWQRYRKMYKKSRWLLIVSDDEAAANDDDDEMDGWKMVSQQQQQLDDDENDENDTKYGHLPRLLDTGRLHVGCDLRRNPATGQIGLFANRRLSKGTIVAVECGVWYSEALHDFLIPKKGTPQRGRQRPPDDDNDDDPSSPPPPPPPRCFVRPKLLQKLVGGGKNKKHWVDYARHKYTQYEQHDDDDPRVPGLVMDSSQHGNETRFIRVLSGGGHNNKNADDDTATAVINLTAVLVVDLQRSPGLTFAWATTDTVECGQELVRGGKSGGESSSETGEDPSSTSCGWDEDVLLGQAQLSHLLNRRYQVLQEIAKEAHVTMIDNDDDAVVREHHRHNNRSSCEYNDNDNDIAPLYFATAMGLYDGKDVEDYGRGCHYGTEFDVLQQLRGYAVAAKGDDDSGGRVRRPTFDFFHAPGWGVPASPDVVRRDFAGRIFAVPSPDPSFLSDRTRAAMRRVPVSSGTNFRALRARVLDNAEHGIEIVRIVHSMHPARLLNLPGVPSYGGRTKAEFVAGDVIACGGGTVEQWSVDTDHENAYTFAFPECWPDGYDGPNLYINGSGSMGGMFNDAWCPSLSSGNGDSAAAAANMEVIRHWDDETQTPQLVFVATRKIEIGDELLGQYGRDYWNIMFQRLRQNHARFAAQTNERCKMLRKMILADTEWKRDPHHYKLG